MGDSRNSTHRRGARVVTALGIAVVASGAVLFVSAGSAAATGAGGDGTEVNVCLASTDTGAADCAVGQAAPGGADVPGSLPAEETSDVEQAEVAPESDEPSATDTPVMSPPCLVAQSPEPAPEPAAGPAAGPAAAETPVATPPGDDITVIESDDAVIWLAPPPVAEPLESKAVPAAVRPAAAAVESPAKVPAATPARPETVVSAATVSAAVLPVADDPHGEQGPALPIAGLVLLAVAGVVRLRRSARSPRFRTR